MESGNHDNQSSKKEIESLENDQSEIIGQIQAASAIAAGDIHSADILPRYIAMGRELFKNILLERDELDRKIKKIEKRRTENQTRLEKQDSEILRLTESIQDVALDGESDLKYRDTLRTLEDIRENLNSSLELANIVLEGYSKEREEIQQRLSSLSFDPFGLLRSEFSKRIEKLILAAVEINKDWLSARQAYISEFQLAGGWHLGHEKTHLEVDRELLVNFLKLLKIVPSINTEILSMDFILHQ